MSSSQYLSIYQNRTSQRVDLLDLDENIFCLFAAENGDLVSGRRAEGYQQSVLERITQHGEMLWSTVWDENAHIRDIAERPDGRFLVVGEARDDPFQILFACFGADGSHQWTWHGRSRYKSTSFDLISDSELIVAGYRSNNLGMLFPFLARYRLLDSPVSGVPLENNAAPMSFSLVSVYPNPFNSMATVHWTLDRPGMVSLTIYDMLGRPVRTVVRGEMMGAGAHSIALDGEGLASGAYLLRVCAGAAGHVSRLIVLVK